MADGDTKKAPAVKPVQPATQENISSIPQEPTKAYVLGTIDWAAIGSAIEAEIKEEKIWEERYYRQPDHLQALIYKHSINPVTQALPSTEEK